MAQQNENKNLAASQRDYECALHTIQSEIDTLRKLQESLGPSLTAALDLMQAATGRIIITGIGKSGHIGKKIAASLASTGTPAFFVHPAEASHGDLGMITEKDIVLAISNSGESKELVDIVNYCKRFAIKLIAITKNATSSLAKAADIVLLLPNNGEADPLGLAPTNSTTATLVLGDILTSALISRRGFTETDFNNRHPGGQLGTILQTVQELMHTGADMPLLPQDTPFEKIIVEMSSKRLGCVGFTDEKQQLCGIFTDGDLRRNMSPSLFNKIGKDIMHPRPQQVSPNTLASTALRIMNEKKITSLFVTQDNKPIGIIHIHDLLQHKVA